MQFMLIKSTKMKSIVALQKSMLKWTSNQFVTIVIDVTPHAEQKKNVRLFLTVTKKSYLKPVLDRRFSSRKRALLLK